LAVLKEAPLLSLRESVEVSFLLSVTPDFP